MSSDILIPVAYNISIIALSLFSIFLEQSGLFNSFSTSSSDIEIGRYFSFLGDMTSCNGDLKINLFFWRKKYKVFRDEIFLFTDELFNFFLNKNEIKSFMWFSFTFK